MATPHGSALLQPDDGSVTPGSARSLLFTILGDLVWPTGQPVWTATLVQVLRGLGIEEQTARQAIARAASSDWITAVRTGREVSWSLTPKLQRIFESGSLRVYSLSDSYSQWDGRWLVVLPTIPASHRPVRRPLYTGLTWAGLGNPAPGLWVTPHVERVTEIRELVDRLDLQRHTVSFAGTVEAIGLDQREIVDRGWDLASLREHYEQVERIIGALAPRTADENALREHPAQQRVRGAPPHRSAAARGPPARLDRAPGRPAHRSTPVPVETRGRSPVRRDRRGEQQPDSGSAVMAGPVPGVGDLAATSPLDGRRRRHHVVDMGVARLK